MQSSENDRLIDFEEMASGSFVFSWTVAATGYQWADGTSPFHDKEELSRWLIDPTPPGVHGEWRRYSPLRHHGLHRRFAKLAPTEEAILGFANEYGLLDGGEWPLKVTGSSVVSRGERLDLWVEEIKHMALLVRLWDLQKRNGNDLARYVWWQEDGTVRIPVACYWDEGVGRWSLTTLDRDAEDGMATSVGRLRPDHTLDNAVKYVLVSHNTKMGAAKGAVLTAEYLHQQGYV